jgi:hypothetical protein
LQLIIVVAAAAGVAVASIAGAPAVGSATAGIGLIAAAGIRAFVLVTRSERDWYDGRAAAESAKTLAWKYAVAGIPFSRDIDDVDSLFIERLRDAMQLFRSSIAAGGERGVQITDEMRSLRAATLDVRRQAYDASRLADQYKWYSRRADEHKRAAVIWNGVALAGQVVGGVAAVLLAFVGTAGAFVGTAGALTASAIAWLQTKQYDATSRAYALTAQELAGVRSLLPMAIDEDRWAAFVDDAEEAISREHTTWRARRGA